MNERDALLKAELKMFSNCTIIDFANLLDKATKVLEKENDTNKEVIIDEARMEDK